MTSDGDALIAAIISQPDEDTPRLEYADWLDENAGEVPCPRCEASGYASRDIGCLCRDGMVPDGRRERAEFIRVQIAIAQLEPAVREHAGFLAANPDSLLNERRLLPRGTFVRAAEMMIREQELFDTPGAAPMPAGVGTVQTAWRRGFIESVEVTASAWLVHGDRIRAAHPVTRVRLTTRPELVRKPFESPSIRGAHYSLPGRRYCEACGFERSDDGCAARLLAAEWPGVTFELPSPVIQANWDDQPRDPAVDVRAAIERIRVAEAGGIENAVFRGPLPLFAARWIREQGCEQYVPQELPRPHHDNPVHVIDHIHGEPVLVPSPRGVVRTITCERVVERVRGETPNVPEVNMVFYAGQCDRCRRVYITSPTAVPAVPA